MSVDFTGVRTFYWRYRSWIAGRGPKGGGHRWPAPDAVAGWRGHPINRIDRHSGPETLQKRPEEGARGGARPGKRRGRSAPGMAGRRIVRRTPLDNRSTLREDERAERRAAAGSPASWHTCQNADMERDGGRDRWLDAGYGRPQARRRTQPHDRPTSQCSFLFPIEQTEAALFALPDRRSGVSKVISARRQKH